MSDPDLWNNRVLADAKIKELGVINDIVKRFTEIEEALKKLSDEVGQNAKRANDADIKDTLYKTKRELKKLEVENLFTGPYDKGAAVVTIMAGAGGQDAEDWAGMLYEMYGKFAERRGWKMRVIDESLGDFQSKTGRHPLKAVTIEIKGDYAYGYLKKESGVHRLVRISPFSAEKKRHTSFALVEVLPDFPEIKEDEVIIPAEDIRVDFFRSSGPGGQNVNKVETAVRVTHIPTGITVASQVDRSQAQNRERAMKILKAKLVKLMEDTQEKEVKNLRTRVKPEWGSQIRSYVLNPYQLVKDHRTNIETSQVEKILNGELDVFVENDVQ